MNDKLYIMKPHLYTIVSAMYNIRKREENTLQNRPNNGEFLLFEEYIQKSLLFFEKEFPLVLFCEPENEQMLWNLRPAHLHPITRIIPLNYESLPYFCYFENIQKNHQEKPVKNLHAEKFTPLYHYIINLKTVFVNWVANMNPFSTPMFGWMDLRLHDIYNMSVEDFQTFAESVPVDKVVLTQSTYTAPGDIADRADYYDWTRGKVCAGLFLGHKTAIQTFCQLCETEFVKCIHDGYSATDEMIYSFVVGSNHHLFEPHIGDYADVLKNLLHHKNSTHLAMAFLHKSFQEGNHYYTHKVCESIRKGYVLGETLQISHHDTYCVWYYNYVACYWLGKYYECEQILNEYYEIVSNQPELLEHLCGVYYFFREMISYLGNESIVNHYDNLVYTKP
jgi:hypothetical protein